jgi:hypothetical protein
VVGKSGPGDVVTGGGGGDTGNNNQSGGLSSGSSSSSKKKKDATPAAASSGCALGALPPRAPRDVDRPLAGLVGLLSIALSRRASRSGSRPRRSGSGDRS